MYIQVIFFLTIFSVMLLGFHFLLYFSIITFFEISELAIKNGLLALFFVLACSFVLSTVFAHWNDNIITRIYYVFSSVWMGVLASLLAGSFFVWIIILINKIFHLNISSKYSAIVFFVFFLIVLIFGIFSAFDFRIKNIEVSIKNLPESWEGKTIIQLSDVHLGLVNRLFFARKINELVNSVDHDMVVITGDLFDGQAGDLGYFVSPLNDIKAEHGIYYVTGNHETYYGTEKTYDILSKTKITSLKDELVEIDGLQIIGISFPERYEKKNMKETLESIDNLDIDKPNILLYHEPVLIESISKTGIDLMLAGHTHRGQMWPFRYITHIMYKGYDYGKYVIGDFTLYVSNGTGTWGPPIRTFNKPEIVAIKLKRK